MRGVKGVQVSDYCLYHVCTKVDVLFQGATGPDGAPGVKGEKGYQVSVLPVPIASLRQ